MRSRPATTPASRTLPSTFTRLSRWTSSMMGKPASFALALFIMAGWAVSGPLFHYSNGWQLFINTGTNVVTFLMVFLIQATQNRDSAAIHVKLDEIIRAMKGARNSLLDLESLSDEELDALKLHFTQLADQAKRNGHDVMTAATNGHPPPPPPPAKNR